ncbi:MAG: 1-acyl-sn-glycerol-3-phosphate acyltransferase [Bacilli bacterium]|jgi:1-acyl-sn-glycerol-3-phosphate acyltransferase|nr:1-acyl-sn-glycerol-3-phosphate acyltransferase [Bacilli bacterium]MCH4210733.1 1-acyl-sn-glycerol-3-phosphate acyltransferase [Bacilli bacterium]MCH4228232.1 1-acyl-sn-glycerol-3-phosphate acyltransferase [Bacilli bacterium]MCH4278016.1 1-acyl-sn-glycerol-3-phosphate acyltransferase [Bacilli bacterium]MCI2055257.1 1-acyl-sn-glycerol-3-phosphate acyltransferase [Bacilli bacterium]
MRTQKTQYYKDPLNDDFTKAQVKMKHLPENFRYLHKGLVYYVFSCFLYYVIAIPVLWLVGKIGWSFRVVGAKKIRKAHLRHGYFLYGNHTSVGDGMFAPTVITNPRKSFLVCSREAVSIPGIRYLEVMLGAMPLPETPKQTEKFIEAISHRYYVGNPIIIFPEAHIWPYCTRIRPFPETSFTYPAQLGAPVFAMCTTYEEHRIFKFRKPRPVVHVSDPIYPDMSKPLKERTKLLREAVYGYMVDVSSSFENVEYIRYLPLKDDEKK